MSQTALTLYKISDEVQARMDSLDLCETDEQRAELQRELNLWLEAQVRKVDGVAEYIRFLESQAAFAKAEAERMTARRKAIEAAQAKLEKYVVDIMQRIGEKKLEGKASTLKLRSCPPSVVIEDEARVPRKYKHVTVTMSADDWAIVREEIALNCEKDILEFSQVEWHTDKRAIKKDIDAGVTVAGADIKLGENRLEIK